MLYAPWDLVFPVSFDLSHQVIGMGLCDPGYYPVARFCLSLKKDTAIDFRGLGLEPSL